MTNKEKIQSMSTEELAIFILNLQEIYKSTHSVIYPRFLKCKIDWLESEAKE